MGHIRLALEHIQLAFVGHRQHPYIQLVVALEHSLVVGHMALELAFVEHIRLALERIQLAFVEHKRLPYIRLVVALGRNQVVAYMGFVPSVSTLLVHTKVETAHNPLVTVVHNPSYYIAFVVHTLAVEVDISALGRVLVVVAVMVVVTVEIGLEGINKAIIKKFSR